MLQIYNRFFLFSIVLINLFLTSCKDKEQHPIPNVAVNVLINLNLPAYQNLNVAGGWAYVNGGSKGIVVYRNFDEFVALDRHSTYEASEDCSIVKVDPNNFFTLLDSCSDSQYNIVDGTVTKGPAKWGLRKYNTYWDGAYTVQVYN